MIFGIIRVQRLVAAVAVLLFLCSSSHISQVTIREKAVITPDTSAGGCDDGAGSVSNDPYRGNQLHRRYQERAEHAARVFDDRSLRRTHGGELRGFAHV